MTAPARFRIHVGPMAEALAEFPPASVEAVVTDPPYELDLMGQSWDRSGVAFDPATWAEVRRVLKPGGHLLAFGATRTVHRIAVAIEDAGFEIRDQIAWIYATGMVHGLDVSKALDKSAGATPEVIGRRRTNKGDGGDRQYAALGTFHQSKFVDVTRAATPAAAKWQGWGTSIKPAMEPAIIARRPLEGTVASNVLAHGVGGLNIDGCRIPIDAEDRAVIDRRSGAGWGTAHGIGRNRGREAGEVFTSHPGGRWPSNVILDPGAASAMDAGAAPAAGEVSRFFYVAKPSAAEKSAGLGGDLNLHPTVKPCQLMRYLCRLVTPPGGTVLDPFMGSGSTGVAALLEGFHFIGCEVDPAFAESARRRMEGALTGEVYLDKAGEMRVRPPAPPNQASIFDLLDG